MESSLDSVRENDCFWPNADIEHWDQDAVNEPKRPIWRETAEVIGVLGVIGSLIVVAMEIRQNTNAVKSATIQAISEQSFEFNRLIIENPDLRAARFASRAGPLTEDQRMLLDMLFAAALRVRQNRYVQAELGALDAETSSEIGTGGIFLDPAFPDYWKRNQLNYSEGFREFFDEFFASLSKE